LQLLTNLAVQAIVEIKVARAPGKGAIMITTGCDHHSQTAKAPPQQRVPPHFCFQRQIASPTRISHNSQSHDPPSQQEPSPNTLQKHTATLPQPMTDNLTKGSQQQGSVYQPQSGYPGNDELPAHHTADSSQQDSADHKQISLDDLEVLQPQSCSPLTAPAEDKSHSDSSSSDSQLCDDHIALDSLEAIADQPVPEAAPAQFLQLRRPQCSRITAQLVPGSERLAVDPSNHGGSCQHSDQTAKADQMDVDAMPSSSPIPGRHKTAGEIGPVKCHIMNIFGWVSLQTLKSSSSMLIK